MEELSVGLLGAGLIAGVHARAYRDLPGVRVVGVADAVPAKAERLAAEHDARAVPGLADLLALGVDLVDVCTPPHHHAGPALTALAAGRHVLCEKPLAATLADASRVVAAAEAAPGLLMVGHAARYEPDHAAARRLAVSGEIGAVRMVTHSTTTSLPGWSEDGWLADPARSGGPLVDQAVHGFDFARWVLGSPAVRVTCLAADSEAGPATYALATVRYASGAVAHVETSWAHPPTRGFRLGAELVGDAGRVSWSSNDLIGGVLHARRGDTEWLDVLGERGYVAELRALTEAIRGGGPSPVPAAEAWEALHTALAAVESARTGATVDLRTWGRP